MLNIGYSLEIQEVIRDFDGWSWNAEQNQIESLEYNLIYQNLRILLGNSFLEEWKKSVNLNIDFLEKMNEKLNKEYGKEFTKKYILQLYQTLIILYIQDKNEDSEKLIQEIKNLKNKYYSMKNRERFLDDISEMKKQLNKKIKEIDKILSSKDLLQEEFIKRNSEDGTAVFSIKIFEKNIKKERKKYINEIEEYNDFIKPKIYLKNLQLMEKKLDIVECLNIEEVTSKYISKNLIELQKRFVELLEHKVISLNGKKEFIDIIYKIRYYRFIPISKNMKINDLKSVGNMIKKFQNIIIEKACENKLFPVISKNNSVNVEIISKILETKIINLECIEISLKKETLKIIINVYDGETLENTIKLEYKENEKLEIKTDKRIKLFI